jgi:hypothetical protein
MSITTSSQTKIAIGTQANATDAASFGADTYTVIGEVESFGAFGDTSEEIKFTSLGDGRTQKLAGVKDAGDFEIVMGYDAADAGQAALKAAFDGNTGAPFSFRVELNNALTTGAGPHHGEYLYFNGVVLSYAFDPGNSKEVIKLKAKVSVTSAVVEVAAA